MKKSLDELLLIKEAVRLTVERMNLCLKNLPTFKTEQDIKDFLGRGLDLAYPTIVASGWHASEPHYEGSTRLLRGFCVIDFGVKYQGYCADITRTVYFGTPSTEECQRYASLLAFHQRLLALVKPGNRLRYYDRLFRKWLGGENCFFIHALGHGLGQEVHERTHNHLDRSEVVTIEPGLYVQNSWGIRIEDDVLVGEGVLSHGLTRELVVIPGDYPER